MPNRMFVLSCLALAISACTTLPQAPSTVIATPQVDLAHSYPLVDSADSTAATDSEITSSAEIAPSIAASRWQDFYADDKLKALIAIGLENNKNLTQAALNLQKIGAQYQITRAKALPSIGASGNYNYTGNLVNNSADHKGTYAVGLGLASYEVDFWGKVHALKEQALQHYLTTEAARNSLQIALVANIAQSYANISYAKAQLILAQSTVNGREQALLITQKRFEAGIDSKNPTLQAQNSLDNARLAVIDAKAGLIKSENALRLLIGTPIPPELSPDPALNNLIGQTLHTGLPSELLYYRPDIAQAEYQLKAAGANIDLARAAFFPSISLSGNLGLASVDLSNLFGSSALSWGFTPNINLPIFDAGERRANYDVAVVEQQQKLAAYEESIQNAFREVNDVLTTRASLEEQLAIQYRLQHNYQQSYDIAFAVFRAGLSNYLEVLDAERSLFAIQQTILQLELQKLISQISLYQALGGGANLPAKDTPNADTDRARLANSSEVVTLQPENATPAQNKAPSSAVATFIQQAVKQSNHVVIPTALDPQNQIPQSDTAKNDVLLSDTTDNKTDANEDDSTP